MEWYSKLTKTGLVVFVKVAGKNIGIDQTVLLTFFKKAQVILCTVDPPLRTESACKQDKKN